jgi:hypothetical protein
VLKLHFQSQRKHRHIIFFSASSLLPDNIVENLRKLGRTAVNHSPLSTVPEAVENRGLSLPSFLPSTQADVHTLTRTRRHKRTATKDQAESFAGCCSGHFFTLASRRTRTQSLLCALPPCAAQQPAAVHDTTETRARLKSAHLRHYCAACKTSTAPPRSKLVPVLVG